MTPNEKAKNAKKRKETTPTVCIVESINFLEEATHREGEIIARTLRLSNKPVDYVSLRSREELESFAKEFGESTHRYLHISCHGNEGVFFTTLESIPAEEFAEILKPHLDGRRLFLSTCLATDATFAEAILKGSKCTSIVGPEKAINFDDAAIFRTSFYHLMFKHASHQMKRPVIRRNVIKCATLVGERFNFCWLKEGKVEIEVLGPEPISDNSTKDK